MRGWVWLILFAVTLILGGLSFMLDQKQKQNIYSAPTPEEIQWQKAIREEQLAIDARKKQEAMEQIELDKKNLQDFLTQYESLREWVVREPSRPLVHFRQEILKLHYLWLNVRDSPLVTRDPKSRDETDAMVSKMVASVERDQALYELLREQKN